MKLKNEKCLNRKVPILGHTCIFVLKSKVFITIFQISWNLGTLSSYFDIFISNVSIKCLYIRALIHFCKSPLTTIPYFCNLKHFNKTQTQLTPLCFFFILYNKFRVSQTAAKTLNLAKFTLAGLNLTSKFNPALLDISNLNRRQFPPK